MKVITVPAQRRPFPRMIKLDGQKSVAIVCWLMMSIPTLGTESSKNPPLERFEFAQIHMGTEFRLVLYADNESIATTSADAAFARVAALDQTLSDYRDDSELTLLSKSSGSVGKEVGEDLWKVLSRSDEIARHSQGAFDVTVGPAVRLWRRARRTRQIPTPARVEQVLGRIGHEKVHLDPASKHVRLDTPEMILDLGGIAKGYAVDEARRSLKEKGMARCMVVGGGEIAVGAPPPGKAGWKIALNMPGETNRVQPEYLILSHANVSTSGDASQFVEVDGVRYSHLVDPRTGQALTHRRQVTVLADNGMTADACSSALSVLGDTPAGRDLIRWAGLIVRGDEWTEKGWKTWTTESWSSIPKEQADPKTP
jgi:FAD:protein FMN transferase